MLKNLILWPLSVLYGIGVSIRNRLFNLGILKIREFDVPIICVGNITVGGTGKTPHTESLINELKNDYRVACLSRGYKRKTSGFVLATENSTANDIGDEPMQIKNKFPEITVAVDADRVRGIKKLMQLPEKPEVIILDDGFQHRYVKADINIMLIDYNRPIYEDHLLPLGRLRESIHAKDRANYVIVTKCPEEMNPLDRRIMRKVLIEAAYQNIYFTRMEAFRPQPVFGEAPAEGFDPGTEVILMSGIGNPAQFVRGASACYRVVGELRFEDHHVYRVKDLKTLAGLIAQHPAAMVLTTEKDAVKLAGRGKVPAEIRSRLFYQPINISFIDDSATDFLQNLEKDVKSDS